MHWRFRKLRYDILIPKLEKNIFALSEEETESYFQWYMEQVPKRVAYVSEVCAKELHIPVSRMDCSPESLLLLWKWFRKRAKTEKIILTEDQKKQKKQFGTSFIGKRQLTLETEYILRDIGMYVGETFRKNNDNIYWTYYTKPRRDFFVNHPLLKGFVERDFGEPCPISFEPIHMVGVQASKLLAGNSKDTDLLNLYNWWDKKQ